MAEAFEIQDNVLIKYHGEDKEVIIPDGIKEIGERAFFSCESLTSVVIPEGVRKIEEYAFSCCKNLVSVTFPKTLESIETCAFYRCSSLPVIRFPEGLRYIEAFAFGGCPGLTSVEIPGSVWEVSNAFSGNTGLTSVIIREGVQGIVFRAFVECTELLSVSIPASVTEISLEAFSYCPKLTLVCKENTFAHKYCIENRLPFIFDYQFEAFHGVIPSGIERLSSPFLADEETPYIFISYSHKDRERVLPVIKGLYESGWRIWYDEGLTIGDRYDAVLRNHVMNCAAVLLFATKNATKSAYILENELPWAESFGKPIIKCALDEGTEYGTLEGPFVATVSPTEIEPALAGIEGLEKGDKRIAKGISVAVNPADRYDSSAGTRSALCLYTPESEASAQAISLEAKNSGCSFYDAGGSGRDARLLRECACLVVFLDHSFLADERLTEILINAWKSGKDLAVCKLENIDEADLPKELITLQKMQWLNFVQGISGDMIKKLVRHLEKRGCRDMAAMPGFEYEETKRGIVLKRYTGREASLWIEQEYGGIPVVEIADEAFMHCITLRSIVLPDSIRKIGKKAFEGCQNLSSLQIGKGLEELDWRVFCDCPSLVTVNLPDGMREIGEGAFAGCKGLVSITIPDSVKTIRGYAFSGCSSLNSVTIPKSLKWIEYSVFNECKALTSVVIPGNVSGIRQEAFMQCDHLTSVEIQSGVRSIGEDAFVLCENLTSVHLPESVKTIDTRAFRGCKKAVVTCPEGSYAQKFCKEQSIPVQIIPKERTGFFKRLFG